MDLSVTMGTCFDLTILYVKTALNNHISFHFIVNWMFLVLYGCMLLAISSRTMFPFTVLRTLK